MDGGELIQLYRKVYPPAFSEAFEKAASMAREYLQQKRRLAGDSYFDHALRVAKILLENKADAATVVAAIVQEIFTPEREELIQQTFDPEIVSLAKGVSEIKQIKSKSKQLEAEALRKVLFATTKDPRIIVIKLAKKLDNVRTMEHLPEAEQKRIAQEVLEFYAPLAYRLGMERIKNDLETGAFCVLQPQQHAEIQNFLQASQEEREKDIHQAIQKIQQVAAGLPLLKITGRPKHVYSIYHKLTQRGVPWQEQFDLLGVRAIVANVTDCYALLGKLHEHFEPLPGKLKDYIAYPKPNLYQSIHTAVRLSSGKVVEVQIRTPEMDEFAEEGLAAHWKYKGVKSDELFEKKMAWLRGVLELQREDHFLEVAKVDVFGDTIACYTPKGDVKELPQGGGLLDFAYQVHEEVGNHAIGGRVNGKFVPLRHKLVHGDVVEIVTNKLQRPRRSWLKFVTSAKTRQKIRKALKEFEDLPALFYHELKPVVTEDQSIMVESLPYPNATCILAKCCLPLPGQEIVGIVTKRRVVSVHQKECRSALKEEKRWVAVTWKQQFSQQISFCVEAGERSGILADLLHTIAQAGFSVKEAKAKMKGPGAVECAFHVIPRDLAGVQEMISRVQKVRGIQRIYFE